jgi:hypothetical protein
VEFEANSGPLPLQYISALRTVGTPAPAIGSDQGTFVGRACKPEENRKRSKVSTTAPVQTAEFAVAVYPVRGTSRRDRAPRAR